MKLTQKNPKAHERDGYLLELPAWKKRDYTFSFQPGLNLILGPNGIGKSSILTCLAKYFCCYQGGVQKITDTALSFETPPSGLVVEHTGDPVLFADSSKQVGVVGGCFDFDFIQEGIREASVCFSHGQRTMTRLEQMVEVLIKKSTPAVPVSEKVPHLQGSGQPTGGVTLLVDEPEKSLDIRTQIHFLLFLRKHALVTGNQILVATHCPFALYLPAHVIELEEGYTKQCRVQSEAFFEAMQVRENINSQEVI
jgi:predicted ATPase